MSTIIDRRKSGKNKSVENRKRFIERYKGQIKQHIDSTTSGESIADMAKDKKVKIPAKDIKEHSFSLNSKKGRRKQVLAGNKQLGKGDKIDRDQEGDGERGTGGSEDGEGTDEFEFSLSREEFLELYFSDMELPSFVKESMKNTKKSVYKRHGYTKDGIPSKLDLVKTLKQALARRIATSSTRYLDDVDLRYRLYVRKPIPIRHAVMFLLMDVSASMEEFEKSLAKKFYFLLYLFLEKEYNEVDLIFVRHTSVATECTEQEFFYGRETGGTIVSEGLNLVSSIIDKRIDLTTSNVYVAQASDGDNFEDDSECQEALIKLLEKVQYFAYIQTESSRRSASKMYYDIKDLYVTYGEVEKEYKNLAIARVNKPEDVYPVLHNLFKKGQ